MKWFVAVLGFLIVATMVGCFLALRPYWLYVSRSDLGVPQGFYRCRLHSGVASRVRQCGVGADGVVFREETHLDGAVHRRWFANGRIECMSEIIGPTGERIAAGDDNCRRISESARSAGPAK
ncbi:hypothetical protein ACN28E_23575 [Archangium lansingense]|uniref:hypothetical protein n=1 Tax=Archangium lansingense TaxID=2995310 RepID=UPI003B78DA63